MPGHQPGGLETTAGLVASWRYRPVHWGVRFSANAAGPSR
jgi:hypothetical protein